MHRTFNLILLIFLLIFAGLVTIQPAMIALSFPLIFYLLAGILQAPERLDVRVERTCSAERVLAGNEVTITLKVTNQGKALEEILLDDQIPDGLVVSDGSKRHLVALSTGETVAWNYTLRGRRGYYGLNKVRATANEALGLVKIGQDLYTDGQLFILPPVLRLRRVAIQPRRTRIFSGTIPTRQGGSGVEFFNVRDYQKGDSPRWINWRATARHPQNVYSNEFEQERSADVGLVLDGRRRTNDFNNRSIFEHSVLATAALADAFLNAGNRVGLLFYGRQIVWTMPGYGKLQSERILHDLSRLEPGDSQNFNGLYIPRHLFPSRSQLVLISPLLDEDYDVLAALRLRGSPLLVVSPDPVSFEANGLPRMRNYLLAMRIASLQRAALLRRLRGTGARIVDWDTSQPFEKAAKGELERRSVLPRGDLR